MDNDKLDQIIQILKEINSKMDHYQWILDAEFNGKEVKGQWIKEEYARLKPGKIVEVPSLSNTSFDPFSVNTFPLH